MNTTDFRAEIYDIVSKIEPVDLLECVWKVLKDLYIGSKK